MMSLLAGEVAANQNSQIVSPEYFELNNGSSHLEVRKRGCFILDLALVSPSTGEPIHILYAEDDKTKPKLSASHIMIPVGPSDGPGGQHGPYRWLDYESTDVPDSADGEKRIRLSPTISGDLEVSKSLWLAESRLTTMTTVRNTGKRAINTSVGAHDYFRLEDENLDGILLGGNPLGIALDRPDAVDALLNEETLFIDNFRYADIHFPAGYDVQITAFGQEEYAASDPEAVGMMIWKRKDTESVCFEPTLGRKSGLRLRPGSEATLFTTVELL